jgi:transposase
MKKQKYKKETFLEKYAPIVKKYKDTIPGFIDIDTYEKENLNTGSWFSIHKCTSPVYNKLISVKPDKIANPSYKMIKVDMELNATHKMIFQKWFKASTFVYNEALNYIKGAFPFTKNAITKNMIVGQRDFYNNFYVRNQLKDIKTKIQKDFSFMIDKDCTISKKKDIKCDIDIHTLDKTIFQLTQNIKSAVSNLRNGNFKFFRMKYWKYTRPSQTIEMEKSKIKDGFICKSIFKDLPKIKFYYNNTIYNLDTVNCDFKINYNSILDKYTLMVPVKIENIYQDNKNNIIILDPGLRTFMTGISNNEYTSIGNDIHSKIKMSLCRLNKIKANNKIPIKIKKKNERLINRKIENKVNEMHWKIIDYLTKNYKTILLGDMSAKSIVKKNSSVLSNVAKVACLRMKFYEFRMRLIYKCGVKNRNFKLIDEFYTSKTCSMCGSYNDGLEGEIEYKCKKCNIRMHRDINGCRNIYMKQFI